MASKLIRSSRADQFINIPAENEIASGASGGWNGFLGSSIEWLLRGDGFSSSGGSGSSNEAKFHSLRQWQNAIYFTLCSCYAVLAVAALVQLVRIQMRVPEYGWTTQKVFHLMNFVVNGARSLLFGLYQQVYRIHPDVEMMLMDLPGVLFFSTYTLLVLFWAEIYHQARSVSAEGLRSGYYIVNAVVYFIQIIIWIAIRVSRGHTAIGVAKIFFAVISFVAAVGFLIYGGRLFVMLRRFPIESRGRQKKLYEVGFVTGVCCTCFLVRCVVNAVSAFDNHVEIDVADHPVMNLFYYGMVEIFPSAMVLFLLRKLPPRRVSDQYHAIK